MPVHNLHCSQAHQLWSLNMAKIRPGETTLHPLCLPRLFVSSVTALCWLLLPPMKNSFVLPHDDVCPSSTVCPSFPFLTSPLAGICWRIDPNGSKIIMAVTFLWRLGLEMGTWLYFGQWDRKSSVEYLGHLPPSWENNTWRKVALSLTDVALSLLSKGRV